MLTLIDADAAAVAAYCSDRSIPPLPLLPTAEALGLTFPLVGWEKQAVHLARDVANNWLQFHSDFPSVRNVLSFAAQGASGTGKTRLGQELARLILLELRKLHDALPDLIAAVEQCVQRGLTLRYDFKQHLSRVAESTLDRKPDDIRAADMLWSAYVLIRLPQLPSPWRKWQPSSIMDVFEAISQIERHHSSFAGPLAVVVHLDECQELTAKRLGELIYRVHSPFYSVGMPTHKIFPVRACGALRLTQLTPPRSFTSRASTSCKWCRPARPRSPSTSRCHCTPKSTTQPSASTSLASHRRK